jgi:hypothetical protein
VKSGMGLASLDVVPGFRGACHRAGHFGPDPLAQSGLQTKKGGGTPTDAYRNDPHRRMRRALAEARSAVGVPPRLLPGGSRPFRSAPGQASWDSAANALARRALPAPTCPSPGKAPPAPAVVPKRMMPGAAPAQVASPRGSTALAPPSDRLRRCPSNERDSRRNVADMGTNVKTMSQLR